MEEGWIGRAQQHLDDALQPSRVCFVESARRGTIDVQYTQHPVTHHQWHDDFGAGRRVAGDMPWKLVHVLYDQRLTVICARTANALPKGNPNAGYLALERSEHEFALPSKVETAPVDFGKGMEEERTHIGGIRDEISLSFQNGFRVGEKLPVDVFAVL